MTLPLKLARRAPVTPPPRDEARPEDCAPPDAAIREAEAEGEQQVEHDGRGGEQEERGDAGALDEEAGRDGRVVGERVPRLKREQEAERAEGRAREREPEEGKDGPKVSGVESRLKQGRRSPAAGRAGRPHG
jgi:hypothetical protein